MNWVIASSLIGSALFLGHPASAGTAKVAISVTAKKDDGEKKHAGNTTQKETLFQYVVKLANGSFAPANGLVAKYRVFIREDSGKGTVSQQKMRREEFQAPIPDMPKGGSYTFNTEPVKLHSSMLDSYYYYANGTRSRSQDRVVGVWIRLYQGDEIVGEYVNPSTLAAKEKF